MASFEKKLQKSTNRNTTLDKESTFELIKAVFREESQKQWQVISKIISSNLIATKQESGQLRKEINDLQLQKVSSLLKMYLKKKFQKLKGPFASLYPVHIIKHVLIVFY